MYKSLGIANQTFPTQKHRKWTAWCLPGLIVLSFYSLITIQPWISDDWCPSTNQLIQWPIAKIPYSGQAIQVVFGAYGLLTVSPFSLFRPWTFMGTSFVALLLWRALGLQNPYARAALTSIALLGFPYFGTLSMSPAGSAEYTFAAVWMFIWILAYHQFQAQITIRIWNWVLLFVMSFITTIWSEVFLIAFSGLVSFLYIDAWLRGRKLQTQNNARAWLVASIVLAGYLIALLYYTRGGTEQFLDSGTESGRLMKILNFASIVRALIIGSKEILVLVKDCLPLLLIIGYLKQRKVTDNRQIERYFHLLLGLTAGMFVFMFVGTWLVGVIHWRTRWLCAMIFLATCYVVPNSAFSAIMEKLGLLRQMPLLTNLALGVAICWLVFNAFFTYAYTNIDVVGWLQYRQMVVDRNPAALTGLCCKVLPEGRPKGVAWWDHTWGAQDDRYRFFLAPNYKTIKSCVAIFWEN